jgi:hypothetical protein
MLIDLPYKEGDTITIKTSAGEEILARLVEETDKAIKVHKPMAIMATQQGIGLGPFAFTIKPDADVLLNKNVILMITKTEKEMAAQYVQNTTGIAV